MLLLVVGVQPLRRLALSALGAGEGQVGVQLVRVPPWDLLLVEALVLLRLHVAEATDLDGRGLQVLYLPSPNLLSLTASQFRIHVRPFSAIILHL